MSKWDKKRSGHADRLQREEGDEGSSDEDNEVLEPVSIDVRICLWEFGQNDPKRFVYFRVTHQFQVIILISAMLTYRLQR